MLEACRYNSGRQTTGSRPVDLVVGASFDDDNVDAGERQLDIPRHQLSSGIGVPNTPGNVFPVVLPVHQTAVKDPHETVRQRPESLVVCLAPFALRVVVASGPADLVRLANAQR
jgi:hypothetical protein